MNLQPLAITFTALLVASFLSQGAAAETHAVHERIRVLIIDGHNPYHEWQVTSPLMKRLLEDSGRFTVDIATVPVPADYKTSTSHPAAPADTSGFRPKFADYDVVIGNYVGPRWPAETERDFLNFLAAGGGFVAVHSADNAFTDWPEYNQICGVGGWYGRNERSGPHVYLDDDGNVVRDTSRGHGGHHGPQHEYKVRMRDLDHPITRGFPEEWLHAQDELYDSLRGPAENMHILATSYSDPQFSGTGKHEPSMMTLEYGPGRIFHVTLGHADYSMKCVGFVTALRRGTEWAATGEVTIPVPDDFPTATESKSVE